MSAIEAAHAIKNAVDARGAASLWFIPNRLRICAPEFYSDEDGAHFVSALAPPVDAEDVAATVGQYWGEPLPRCNDVVVGSHRVSLTDLGMQDRGGKLRRGVELLLTGVADRVINRSVGMARGTIKTLRQRVEALLGVTILCSCGQPANHNGWCSNRFLHSAARQEVMSRVRSKGRDPIECRDVPELERLIAEGKTTPELCAFYDICRPVLRKWIAAYGLPKPRNPRGKGARFASVVVQFKTPKRAPNPKPVRLRRVHEPIVFKIPAGSLLDRINQAVPRISAPWRDDLIQDVAVAIVCGDLQEGALADVAALSKFRRSAASLYHDKRRYVSLDHPIRSDEGKTTLLDLLRDENAVDPSELIERDEWVNEYNLAVVGD